LADAKDAIGDSHLDAGVLDCQLGKSRSQDKGIPGSVQESGSRYRAPCDDRKKCSGKGGDAPASGPTNGL